LGEGGFAVVYCAEQTEPIRRQVPLKIIKLGMDTRQVIARFEAEPLALECDREFNVMHGPQHPETVRSINRLVDPCEAWDKPREAASWRERLPPPEP
jgi:hypothetical protein